MSRRNIRICLVVVVTVIALVGSAAVSQASTLFSRASNSQSQLVNAQKPNINNSPIHVQDAGNSTYQSLMAGSQSDFTSRCKVQVGYNCWWMSHSFSSFYAWGFHVGAGHRTDVWYWQWDGTKYRWVFQRSVYGGSYGYWAELSHWEGTEALLGVF